MFKFKTVGPVFYDDTSHNTNTSIFQRDVSTRKDTNAAVEKNLNALERILRELDVHCDVRSPEVIAKLYNLTTTDSSQSEDFARRSVASPSMRRHGSTTSGGRTHRRHTSARSKRAAFDHFTASLYLYKLYGTTPLKDDVGPDETDTESKEEENFEEGLGGSDGSSGSSGKTHSDPSLEDGETPQKRQKIIGAQRG